MIRKNINGYVIGERISKKNDQSNQQIENSQGKYNVAETVTHITECKDTKC